jgi:hypothetical protein
VIRENTILPEKSSLIARMHPEGRLYFLIVEFSPKHLKNPWNKLLPFLNYSNYHSLESGWISSGQSGGILRTALRNLELDLESDIFTNVLGFSLE